MNFAEVGMAMLKLLMVDDEQWVRERFSERIPWSDAGFTFLGAASGAEEAIRMIERDMPHLLLTDITMPNMNGLELAGYVRKRWPKIRIVILTAYSEFEYAQQAIGLGVDNYLIKLAQTPEQILDACRKVAEEIEQEMDIDQKLEMRRKLEWEKEWSRKREWTEQLVDEAGNVPVRTIPGEWFDGLEHTSYTAGLTIGWSAAVGSMQEELSKEELIQLQKQVSEVLEERLDQRTIGEGCQMVMLPIQQSRLHMLFGSRQPLNIFHMNQLALIVLETLKVFKLMRCFIHVSPIRELGKQPLTGKQIAAALCEGLDGLAAYFYNSESAIINKQAIAFRLLDAELNREWISSVVKALQRENAEGFQESVSVMTKLYDPPIHPVDLLRLTRQMFQPELVKLPSSVIKRLSGIDRLETWADYCGWWAETTHAIHEWMNNRFHPPAALRREVQLMCRYIREHYKEDVQASELSELIQMHPSYAGQMFKQEVGENISEYLNRVRMEKAGELLERTTMKIYEVSGAVGISDYRYFCKLFKSSTGYTPTQYKNKQV
ncbi:response regulator [Paenibacillus psychroresistens]|uniref:Response regulator n=1 Tax=Paenibacillus psychroresistens TaxID=1778678 RepID=A0A6B8RF26_9BACL|nr:response regulator [Paenibacillus psychroresistens]QGQ94038.1 response regulator [Paenibacillus psychroresistens]